MAANDIPIAQANTWRLSNRSDVNGVALNSLTLYVGEEDKRAAFDVRQVAASGDYVASVGTPTVTPSDELTASAVGGRDYLGVIQLGGTGVAGTDYLVAVDVTLQSGDVVGCRGWARCIAEPTAHSIAPAFS